MGSEQNLAQAMIELNTGHTPNMTIHERRDYLMKAIRDIRNEIELFRKENDILGGFKGKAELVNAKIEEVSEINIHQLFKEIGKQIDTKDVSIQTEPIATRSTSLFHKADKYKDRIQIAYNLSSKEKLLMKRLSDIKLATNHKGPNYLLVKKSEYHDLIAKIEKIATDGLNFARAMEMDSQLNLDKVHNLHHEHPHDHLSITNDTAIIFNNNHVTLSNVETQSQSNQETVLPTSTIVGPSSVSNSGGIYEESDDEGVQLLLSMKRNVFSCKCGEYLNSITDWSEHQKICSRSVEKTIGEQCQLCKKTFLTCVALNIHSTKKHNKKKMRTDSIMHCPCGQSFTAKWRQNCVHKLNSHGRHCKAFKAREIQCAICKKGFIERKSLEYHGLKAHKLAVPVNS